MIADDATRLPDLRSTVDAAVKDFVCVNGWGETVFLNLPMIYPSGTSVTVRINQSARGVRIDDGGFAYRELEDVGAERSFARAAKKVAEIDELEVGQRIIFVEVPVDEIQRAICDVATASWRIADRIYARLADEDTEEITDYLRVRLTDIFGRAKIQEKHTIFGSSKTAWDVSAILDVAGHKAVFHAVSSHSNSVYKASTAFHDIAKLRHPPRLVAVVKDKAAMGHKLGILTQAGRVIQSDQADQVYKRAVAA